MKQFTLADGDIIRASPIYIGATHVQYSMHTGNHWYQFDITLPCGTELFYRHKWKAEVERERNRLVNFDWSDRQPNRREYGPGARP